MPLSLSSAEIEKLTRTAQVLVSPLAHSSVDEWRLSVNRHLKDLLKADSAGFLLPVQDGLMLYSEEHDAAELARYPDYPPPPLVDGTPSWEAWVNNKVTTLARLYGRNYDLYLKSPYYQEYAGANGAHDTLVSTVSLGGSDARGIAALHFWHAHPRKRLFGEREIAILKILRPALIAGVTAHMQWGAQRQTLLTALDSLGQAVLIADIRGVPMHTTPALGKLLARDPEAENLRCQMTETARAVSCDLVQPCADLSDYSNQSLRVNTATAAYEVRASVYRAPSDPTDCLIMVVLERRSLLPRTFQELRQQYGFTHAEARIAVVIARGYTNAKIADEMNISPHTARRHTERIFMKLGAHSRSEVATKVLC